MPQGSVLEPLLFNLAVAHLPRLAAENASTLLMFADDETLYSSHRCLAVAAATASKVLYTIASSLEVTGHLVNETKTVAMIIKPPRSTQALAPVILKSSPLRVVSDAPCLGVMVDDDGGINT